MLNLDETLTVTSSYSTQRDFYIRSLLYSVGVFIFITLLRGQISEINVLQLIPGFYLILLFLSFLFLTFFSDFLFKIPFELDNKKEYGTKTYTRLELTILAKFSIFLFSIFLFVVVTTILPLSLDSFDSYDEESLENLWSLEEIINLELFLVFIVTFLSQLPSIAIFYLNTEKDSKILPEFWKDFSFLVFLISGVITPTIDGYTQLSFAFSSISLYLIILNMVEKRVTTKFLGSLSLSF